MERLDPQIRSSSTTTAAEYRKITRKDMEKPEKESAHVEHIEDTRTHDQTLEDARAGALDEHEETLWQAIKQNRKAVLCSAISSSA